jgi:hypothetical protein
VLALDQDWSLGLTADVSLLEQPPTNRLGHHRTLAIRSEFPELARLG